VSNQLTNKFCVSCGQLLFGQALQTKSPWLSFKNACTYLGIGKTKLRRLITQGRIKHYRIDKIIKIHQHDCDAFLMFEKPFNKLTRPQKLTVNELDG